MKTNSYILRKRFDFAQYKYGIILALAVSAALSMSSCTKEPPEEEEVIHVTGVTLNPTAAFLLVGKTLDLEAIVEPAEIANQTVTWSTSDERVAMVNPAGEVTAVALGTATITATTIDGRYTATCTVTVAVPNITMTTQDSYVSLLLNTNFRNLIIDWGDGQESKITDATTENFHEYEWFGFSHRYSDWSEYHITIVGEHIERFAPGADLTSLDVSGATALTYLYCNRNELTTLDLSRNTELTYLDCSENRLTSLDVSMNTALNYLDCSENKLTALELSSATELKELYCSGNHLTALDVSRKPLLKTLWCDRNKLAALDVSQNTTLYNLFCNDNYLTDLDVSENTTLKYLDCIYNRLTTLDLSRNTALIVLHCDGNILTALDLSANTELIELECRYNRLTALDVSRNTDLRYFSCTGNQLTVLDVSKNTKLYYFACPSNQLTSLDVSQNTKLDELICANNLLSTLVVSRDTAPLWLDFATNQLTASALNDLFRTLPTKYGYIFIEDNPGTHECDRSIAEEKGWEVVWR